MKKKHQKSAARLDFFRALYENAKSSYAEKLDGFEKCMRQYKGSTEIDGSSERASIRDYERISSNFRRFGHGWIDRKNHDRFHKITQLGYSFYMDSYVPRKNAGSWNLFTKSDNRGLYNFISSSGIISNKISFSSSVYVSGLYT